MKKLLAVALYTLPLAIAPTVFAQTSTPAPAANGSPTTPPITPPTTNPGAPATPGTMAPAPAGAGMATPRAATPVTMISGLSVKDKIMGQNVYDEKNEKVGAIEDVVLTPDGKVSTFVVGAGGFLGMGEHNVAIPYEKVSKAGDKLMLEGYTKDQLKALPEVKVAK